MPECRDGRDGRAWAVEDDRLLSEVRHGGPRKLVDGVDVWELHCVLGTVTLTSEWIDAETDLLACGLRDDVQATRSGSERRVPGDPADCPMVDPSTPTVDVRRTHAGPQNTLHRDQRHRRDPDREDRPDDTRWCLRDLTRSGGLGDRGPVPRSGTPSRGLRWFGPVGFGGLRVLFDRRVDKIYSSL